jgi:hypothetical protein
MRSKFIVIDGKTYNSVNDMPEDVRRLYEQAMSTFKDQDGNRVPDAIENNTPNMLEDKNRNGVPDIIENTAGGPLVANAMKILFDGREFNNIDELPPEARARYDQAMGTLDANRNGIPDFVEGMIGNFAQPQQSTPVVSTSFETDTTRHASRQPMPVNPTIEPDRPNGLLLALLGLVLFFGCVAVAAGVWYFYLR